VLGLAPAAAEEYHQQYLAKGGRNGNAQSPKKGCSDPIRCGSRSMCSQGGGWALPAGAVLQEFAG
jgi:hypothetical protein